MNPLLICWQKRLQIWKEKTKKLQDENRKMRGDLRETDHTHPELSSELEDTQALLDEMETTGRSFANCPNLEDKEKIIKSIAMNIIFP